MAAQAKFKEKHGFPVRLLSDPDRELLAALGALQEVEQKGVKKTKIVRSTFVFDERGKLIRLYPKVKVDGHAEAVLSDFE